MVLEESNECSVDALSSRKGIIITLWNLYKTPLGNGLPLFWAYQGKIEEEIRGIFYYPLIGFISTTPIP